MQRALGPAERAAQRVEGRGVGVVAVDVAQAATLSLSNAPRSSAAVMLEAVARARAQLLERSSPTCATPMTGTFKRARA